MKVDLTSPILDFDGTPIKHAPIIVARLPQKQGGEPIDVQLAPTTPITLSDGTEVTAGHKEQDMTLAHVFMETFRAVIKSDHEEPAEDKWERFDFAAEVFKNKDGEVDLPLEFLQKLEKRVAKVFPASSISANVHKLIDSDAKSGGTSKTTKRKTN